MNNCIIYSYPGRLRDIKRVLGSLLNTFLVIYIYTSKSYKKKCMRGCFFPYLFPKFSSLIIQNITIICFLTVAILYYYKTDEI